MVKVTRLASAGGRVSAPSRSSYTSKTTPRRGPPRAVETDRESEARIQAPTSTSTSTSTVVVKEEDLKWFYSEVGQKNLAEAMEM